MRVCTEHNVVLLKRLNENLFCNFDTSYEAFLRAWNWADAIERSCASCNSRSIFEKFGLFVSETGV